MKNDLPVLSTANRALGAATGAYIGDALAMPAHWFYDPGEIRRTFGEIRDYRSPPKSHPGSILWRSAYEPTEPQYDILGKQRAFWGRRDVHYHQFLQAGENTLNLKLLRVALRMIDELGEYDRDEFARRYRAFMLAPDEHRDTYVEECHRGYFENLRAGKPPLRSAVSEKHIGGMVAVVPLYAELLARGLDAGAAERTVLEHVAVTHAGEKVRDAARTLIAVAAEIIAGAGLEERLRAHSKAQDLPYLQGPLTRMALKEPNLVLGRVYSTTCYLEESMPAVLYLALRYAESPEEGLVANTMAGGDNCHRGAVLGALYGLSGGASALPTRWRDGLAAAPCEVSRWQRPSGCDS